MFNLLFKFCVFQVYFKLVNYASFPFTHWEDNTELVALIISCHLVQVHWTSVSVGFVHKSVWNNFATNHAFIQLFLHVAYQLFNKKFRYKT